MESDVKHSAGQRDRAKLLRDVLGQRTPFAALYAVDPIERVAMIKEGLPAELLSVIAEGMSMSKEKLCETMGMTCSGVNRKIRDQRRLSRNESERVMGIARLVDQVDVIVRRSGRAEGFNAAQWVAAWLDRPQAALNGQRPAELMDSEMGRSIVTGLVAQMQSGAYA